jgi:prepilin-type N-terminal cleavage/methylation domain-containing protein
MKSAPLGSYKFGRRFLNSKGFSLVEVMIASAVSLIIVLIASVAFLMAFDVYLRMIRQYDTEAEMSSLMYTMRSSFVTASYLKYGGISAPANQGVTTRGTGDSVAHGTIYAINDTIPAPGGATYSDGLWMVAQFVREQSISPVSGNLQGIQIVYQRPQTASNWSGAVYVDTERSATPGGGWVRLNPVNSAQMYTRLTQFSVDNLKVVDAQGAIVNVGTAGGTPCRDAADNPNNCIDRQVMSAEIGMTMRFFSTGRETDYQWCNRLRWASNAACANMPFVTWNDIDRKMTVVFANNALQRGEYLPRRPFGNLYFFKPWLPVRYGE